MSKRITAERQTGFLDNITARVDDDARAQERRRVAERERRQEARGWGSGAGKGKKKKKQNQAPQVRVWVCKEVGLGGSGVCGCVRRRGWEGGVCGCVRRRGWEGVVPYDQNLLISGSEKFEEIFL